MVRVHAGGGHRKMKKNWRGASLQGMFEEKVAVRAGATVVVRVRAGGGHRKMKKSWRGAGGEGAAPLSQCTRCRC